MFIILVQISRGHPLCEFCDIRYMDSDELFRHLRREHLYCHFCDADGKHQYYNSYDDLRTHFLEEHYLCEEGECRNEQFTAAFRTEIDLKAHLATVHCKNMSRAANKQARTLDIEFTLAPRPRNDGPGRRRRMEESGDTEPGGPLYPVNSTVMRNENQPQFFNSLRSEDFPSLGGSTASVPMPSVTFTSKINPNKLSQENFPSLGK